MSSEVSKETLENETLEQQSTQADAEETSAQDATGEVSGVDTLLQQELQEARQQAEEHYQRYLRTQADFDNFRRRTRQEKEEFAKYGSQKIVEQLLPVFDNFERALAVSREGSDYEALLKGVDMIFRQFEQVLAAEGLQPMEAVGQPFDPALHQAIMQVDHDEFGEGIVVEEVQKGYLLKDKVIRPAMVKVSS